MRAIILCVVAASAGAQERDLQTQSGWRGETSAESGAFLPFTVSARSDAQRALVNVTSGFDSVEGAVVRASTEVSLWHRVTLQGGMTFTQELGTQPLAGVRVQLLRQAHEGVDLAVGTTYLGAGYEGTPTFEIFLAGSRTVGRLGLYANLVYGQELDPSQRNGEVRLAALYRASRTQPVYLGLDGRMGFDLDSGRTTGDEVVPDLDYRLTAGPTASYSYKWLTMMLQTGVSAFREKGMRSQAGGVALGGFAATID